MGNENSHHPIDPNAPSQTLSSRSLDAVADYIKDGEVKRIVVMTGAGISTAAGIPDFRSPETGLYANLARLDLPYAEAVFDISYFRGNPDPFYVLAKELYPGKFLPTVSHSFIALLHKKGLLQMLFTQNIDCLERRAGVPDDKIVEAHGSFATQRCIECQNEYPDDLMRQAVESGSVPHCITSQCNGLVKPDIVFFGEALPEAFHQNKHVPAMADLVIVMGTSLSVQPFASLPQYAREGTPRLLFNKILVGDIGTRPDDVIELGDCDASVLKLADALGWREELDAMWMDVSGNIKAKEAAELEKQREGMTRDEILEAEIEKLAGEVDLALQFSKAHEERVQKQLGGPEESDISIQLLELLEKQTAKEVAQNTESKEDLASQPESSPATTEKLTNEKPAQMPSIVSEAISDTTLPHNRPGKDPSDSKI